jgi:hypothetical protein
MVGTGPITRIAIEKPIRSEMGMVWGYPPIHLVLGGVRCTIEKGKSCRGDEQRLFHG